MRLLSALMTTESWLPDPWTSCDLHFQAANRKRESAAWKSS